MTPAEIANAAIEMAQMDGAETVLSELPEVRPFQEIIHRLERLDDELEEAESRVRQIEKKIELTADQLRLAMGVEA